MFKCQVCDEKFNTEEGLITHQQDEGICPECHSSRLEITKTILCLNCNYEWERVWGDSKWMKEFIL